MDSSYEEKFRSAITNAEKAAYEYAKARALSWQLQELRKTVLASLFLREHEENKGPIAVLENKARAHNEYKMHLQGTAEAIENEHKTKAKYEKFKATYEALRSLSSQETAKIKLGESQ